MPKGNWQPSTGEHLTNIVFLVVHTARHPSQKIHKNLIFGSKINFFFLIEKKMCVLTILIFFFSFSERLKVFYSFFFVLNIVANAVLVWNLKTATDKGDKISCYLLGVSILEGVGCEPSNEEALKYFTKAAEAGHKAAIKAKKGFSEIVFWTRKKNWRKNAHIQTKTKQQKLKLNWHPNNGLDFLLK